MRIMTQHFPTTHATTILEATRSPHGDACLQVEQAHVAEGRDRAPPRARARTAR